MICRKEPIATKDMKILLIQMIKIIEMNILYEKRYENCEYKILKHKDTLLKFQSNRLLHVTLSLNFT
jgi:hypothetical protein